MIFLGKEIRNYGKPFIVAEISGNHGGDFSRALELIEAAKFAGADAVKLQCYEASDLTLNDGYVLGGGTPWEGQTLYELYQQAQTPLDWMKPLFSHAKAIGIPIFSSVYSERGLALLKELNCQAYKIASYDANDINLIKKVFSAGKPVVISVGTLGEDELNRIMLNLDREETDRLVILHCVSKYPTSLNELGLEDMQTLQVDFDAPVGFSCHSDHPSALLLAAALGAAMIEVHLALDDEESTKSPDWSFSFLPSHLRHTIDDLDRAIYAIGIKNDALEAPARELKRSLFVIKNILEGEIFTEEHLRSYRPNLGCSPHLLPYIIGKQASCNIAAGTPMSLSYLRPCFA